MKALLIVSQIAGMLLLAGTMVLLFFRRVYLDAETKQPIEFALPVLGKVKTQSPVLVLAFLGAILVLVPVWKMAEMVSQKVPLKKVSLTGEVATGGKSVQAVVVADPDYTHIQDSDGPFSMNVPLLATDATYRVKFIVDKQVIDDQMLTATNGGFALTRKVMWSPPEADEDPESQIKTKKDVSDAEIEKFVH
jgi:hypothetical protein